MSGLAIRAATPDDAAAIAAIYRPYVETTAITFELDPPDAAAMRARMAGLAATHPWIVGERGGEVVGYAYGYPYRARAAYRWVAETAVYLRQDMLGKRLGTPLYEALIDALEHWGYVAAVGAIALPNRPSVKLHERVGFEHVGTHPRIGFKLGGWHDIGLWQLDLASRKAKPDEPGQPR